MAPAEFKSASLPNLVSFGFQNVGPPSPLYVQRDDLLVLEAISVTAPDFVNIIARFLLPTPPVAGQPSPDPAPKPIPPVVGGPAYVESIAARLSLPTASTVGLVRIPLAEGYLLSCSVASENTPQRGQCFTRVWIARGTSSIATPSAGLVLVSDYATSLHPIAWPGGRVAYPTEGPGNIVQAVVSGPAAGADWTVAVPSNQRWRVAYVGAQLVTSATVANRIVRMQILDAGAGVAWQGPPSAVIPASTTAEYSAAPGQFTSTTDTTTINGPLPGTTMLGGGFTLRTSTLNIQAGDQWSLIRLSTEQWFDAI